MDKWSESYGQRERGLKKVGKQEGCGPNIRAGKGRIISLITG